MEPLVSILIPAYNAEEWIVETIDSALAQTWARKEIIIVNDGSRDQTLAVARRYESGNVKVVTQENQGAAATRNAAFGFSQGDYIQWLDADDLLAPVKVSSQVEVAKPFRDFNLAGYLDRRQEIIRIEPLNVVSLAEPKCRIPRRRSTLILLSDDLHVARLVPPCNRERLIARS